MKRLLIGLAAVTASASLAVPALAATRSVTVGDDFFVRDGARPTLSIHKGDKVHWRWSGSEPHNVTVISGPVHFRSSTKTSGSFDQRLSKRGTYRLVCTIHSDSMRMTIRVR